MLAHEAVRWVTRGDRCHAHVNEQPGQSSFGRGGGKIAECVVQLGEVEAFCCLEVAGFEEGDQQLLHGGEVIQCTCLTERYRISDSVQCRPGTGRTRAQAQRNAQDGPARLAYSQRGRLILVNAAASRTSEPGPRSQA